MDQSTTQYPTGDAFFQFDLNAGDINMATASYMPDGFSLPNTKQEIDACSYVTSDEYAALSPDVLPISQPSISPSSFASSASASASPDALFQDQFSSIPDALYLHSQDTSAATSAVTLPTSATAMAAMAAVQSSLPSPPIAASNTPSPSSKTSDKTSKTAVTTTAAAAAAASSAAAGKPRRKRPNRYHNASEELMQRRRDQNRHSQRAYRERKDQKIKDLEADVAAKERLISQLRNQMRSQQCMHCHGGDFPPPPGRTTAPPPQAALFQHNTQNMHHPSQRAPPPPPQVSYTHSGMSYRTAYMPNTQASLIPQTTPMSMVPPVPIGQAGHSSAAMYGIPVVAGATSSL